MSILLTTFFISLAGIIVMIGRRLMLPSNHHTESMHNFAIDVPDLEEVKKNAGKGLQKISYIVLVITLRIYLLSLDTIKKKYRTLKNKINEINKTRKGTGALDVKEKKEANKFLKMMSDYQVKIKKIKKKIREEEGLN